MKEAEFEIIANKIADVLDNINDNELHAKIKEEMKELASNFVIYDKPIY
jgi:glycine hydroxymethyltransferase